jgi:hypothetical protein
VVVVVGVVVCVACGVWCDCMQEERERKPRNPKGESEVSNQKEA